MFQATIRARYGDVRPGLDVIEMITATNPHFARAKKAAGIYCRS
jgi:hypothetical protein